jgi:murein DD-endopeptidase MepM/ murein hydrolase activator NlpD
MIYPLLAALFFLTVFMTFALPFSRRLRIFALVWYPAYALFILFGTGTNAAREPAKYRLPWRAGAKRFVAQGNNSFTSHRGLHKYAWDFVMPTGTEVLAARDGEVVRVEDNHDGIGLLSNYVVIQHEDGERSGYAHIRKDGALVKVGDPVKRGQPIALSGMVGQTLFPHLHFYVMNEKETESLPVSFEEGVPEAGRFYTSRND